MAKKKQVSKLNNKGAIAAVAAVGIAALGSYAVYKTNAGKPVKKAIGKFVSSAKKEIKAELKKAKVVSKSVYEKAVKDVVTRYNKGGLDINELKAIAGELKDSWNDIQSEFKKDVKIVKKIVKKAGAKSTKKK